jgi:hypothetical protein
MKMEDNNEGGEVVEIDTDLYEYLAILGMKLGQDNVNEFINDVLLFQLKKMRKEEEGKGKEKNY